VKRFSYLLLALAIGLMTSYLSPANAAQSKNDNLTGTWTKTACTVDAAGKPCPFIPDTIQFFDDQTLNMSNVPIKHLAFKTDVTAGEIEKIVKRKPELKGKRLLLIRINPKMEWAATPMIYAYTVEKDELTLITTGWEPAVFARVKK